MKIPSYSTDEFPISALEKLTIDHYFPAEGLEELFVNAQTLGNLMVYFDAVDEARVLAVGEAHLLPDRIERVGNRLMMTANNLTRFFQQGQAEKLRIEVHLPAPTRLNIHFGAGVLRLAGGDGSVTIDGGVGEITGYTHAANVHLHLSAGNVALHNLHGQADVKLNIGAITLNWTELSGDKQINAKCNLGNIDLRLPPAIGVKEERGGVCVRKIVDVPYSTYIAAEVSFGGLGVKASKPVPVLV
ncbi:MAG: DUF4097 domain-containing protein [Chloroflexi bacterium]|nr:DUF4097 domain-containing protein [Chloroflexota bacterium]MCC6896302.1 DUF4097 family beta strand repeat protein [Anaerolineae bacterium]